LPDFLDIQLEVGGCGVAFGVLTKRDKRGDWELFESSAVKGIAAVRGHLSGALDLDKAVQSKSKSQLKALSARAARETTSAVLLWRATIAGINDVRRKAGLPTFVPTHA